MFREFFSNLFFENTHRFFDNDENSAGMQNMLQPPPADPTDRTEMFPERPFQEQGISPFGMMNMFPSFDSAMSEMNSFMDMTRSMTHKFMDPDHMMNLNEGNCFGYSTMKVHTYTNDGTGQPKVYEAEKSTRYAPGGVRQVQKSVRDSEGGVEKISVGRHLGDHGHVISKSRDHHSGNFEQNHDFHGFTEEDESKFNQEWQKVTQQFFHPQNDFFQQHPTQQHIFQKGGKRNKLREECLKAEILSLDQA